MQISALGIPWYREEDWLSLKQLFTDAAKLHVEYQDWLAAAEKGEASLKKGGQKVFRITIEPELFSEWCKLRNLEPNSNARNEYTCEAVNRLVESKH